MSTRCGEVDALEVPAWLNVNSDARAVYAAFPPGETREHGCDAIGRNDHALNRLYRSRWRNVLWHFAHRARLDQSWFITFQKYWSSVLGGRPLWNVEDFHYARHVYRSLFGACRIVDTGDCDALLRSWQSRVLLYQLMFFVVRECDVNQLRLWMLVRHFLGQMPVAFMEYGCGIAPATKTFGDFFGWKGTTRAVIVDIETLAFHYAMTRFAEQPMIEAVALHASDEFQLCREMTVDVVFCIETFEHLNRPRRTVEKFRNCLRPGGVLVFDYYAGNAGAWDTRAGGMERADVLEYIQREFDIVYGEIALEKSVGLTIARRREGPDRTNGAREGAGAGTVAADGRVCCAEHKCGQWESDRSVNR